MTGDAIDTLLCPYLSSRGDLEIFTKRRDSVVVRSKIYYGLESSHMSKAHRKGKVKEQGSTSHRNSKQALAEGVHVSQGLAKTA